MSSPPRILVATDGSPAAEHAVQWCADFARATGAEIVLMHTVSKVGEWLMSVAQIDFVKVEAERRDLLERVWSEPLRKAEVLYRTRFLTGDPVQTILSTAEEEDVDFIATARMSVPPAVASELIVVQSAMFGALGALPPTPCRPPGWGSA